MSKDLLKENAADNAVENSKESDLIDALISEIEAEKNKTSDEKIDVDFDEVNKELEDTALAQEVGAEQIPQVEESEDIAMDEVDENLEDNQDIEVSQSVEEEWAVNSADELEITQPHIQTEQSTEQPESKGKQIKKDKKPFSQRISVRIATSLVTLLVLVVGTLYGVMAVISWGPSPTARDLLINSLMETSAAKFVANLYFSDEEIAQIQSANSVEQMETETDTDLIHIPDEDDITEEVEPLIVDEIVKDTFKGKMMIIADPSRVFVGASNTSYSSSVRGKEVMEIISSYNGVGGTNAGGFSDPGGTGNGGIPLGIVISQGELLWGSLGTTYEVIGIDEDDKLIVGSMTAQQALDKNIRDAVSFGPVLISNGEVMEVSGSGSGLNPRTAIGQRADGAILLLVCDGRQPNSIGASMSDLIDVMIDYGAVNAANLDGGSSTVMYHNDVLINVCASLYGPRDMPTAIVVGPEITGGDASNE